MDIKKMKSKKEPKELSVEIYDTLGVLKGDGETGYGKSVTRTSWNGAIPTIDIRNTKWEDGEPTLLKGISLTEEEAKKLCNILIENGLVDDTILAEYYNKIRR